MKTAIEIDCPPELLISLHMDARKFAEMVKMETAIALFKTGRLSSGMAARWLGVPRAHFLVLAMAAGAELLDDDDDFARETTLL